MNNNLWYKPEKQYDAKERYEKHHREFINKIKNYGWQNVLNGYNQTSMWDNNIWSNNLLKGFGTDYDALSGKNFSVGQGVKYAQNNFNDIATDISYSDTNNRNVDYYFNRDKSDLCKNEGGFIPYAYLDTAQHPRATIGCGVNIEEAPNIKLYNHQTGKRLNDKEINAEINKLKKAHLYNAKPSFYENKSNIRIAPEENEHIMKKIYTDGYNHVVSVYPNFHNYNQDRQKALMDMIYNLGQTKFDKYLNMHDAILRNDWKSAANEAWRCGIGFHRNKKTIDSMYPGVDVYNMSKEHCQNGND